MKRFWLGAGACAVGLGACASLASFESDDPGFADRSGQFEGRFLALSDASMAGSAYADGKLEPFEGAQDQLTLFENGRPVSAAEASNSVISWPQVLAVSPDGKMAATVESRGNLDAGTDAVGNAYVEFPVGQQLTVLAVDDASVSVRSITPVGGANPQSVEFIANRSWLAVATETAGSELILVQISPDGVPQQSVAFNLKPPFEASDTELFLRAVSVSPDGTRLAANIANKRLQFYTLQWSDDGKPLTVVADGPPLEPGKRVATLRWTPDGRYLVAADVGDSDSGGAAMLFLAEGHLTVIAPPSAAAAAKVVSRAKAGIFPEGFALSEDGSRVAAIAMERTYLPQLPFLSNWPRRRSYALTLYALDPGTGALTPLDRVRAAGILPEDVIFDAAGQNLAVAVFHRRKGDDRLRGFIDFFAVSPEGKLIPQNATQAVMRGPHDLVRLPE